MFCGLCDRLKSYSSNRPPVVVFMFCIATLAVVLMSFAYFVKVTELSDPEITEEWRLFLNNFAKIEFCVYGNETEFTRLTSPQTTKTPHKIMTTSKHAVNTTVSVQMLVEFEPTETFLPVSHNVTRVTATVRGDQLGFTGSEASQSVGMAFHLPHPYNLTQCVKHNSCGIIKILTCINFLAPVGMFPATRKPVCNTTDEITTEQSAHLLPQTDRTNKMKTCYKKSMIRFKNEYSKAFTVMLTMKDRSLINLHLMHTSYFLFVMVVMLICYAAIKGSNRVRIIHNNTEKITITS